AGEWGAQLVCGVLDEAALLFLGTGESGEHVVEGVTQATDLVVASVGFLPTRFGGDGVEAPGGADVLGGVGQAYQSVGHTVPDEPADRCGAQRHEQTHPQDLGGEPTDDRLGGRNTLDELHGAL